MFARRVGVVVVLLALAAGLLLLLPWVVKSRARANEVGSMNNLRELALFAFLPLDRKGAPQPATAVDAIPPGTVPNAALPPDSRLSWYVHLMPGLDQKRQQMGPLLDRLDRNVAWNAGPNAAVADTRLVVSICPGQAVSNATNYVGVGGLGTDAPTLPLGPPPEAKADPRAGCFRYGGPTPLTSITDGTSQTLLFAETVAAGPWLRGGPGTVRTFDPTAAVAVGPGGAVGGCFPNVAHVTLADGGGRTFTTQTNPKVLYAMSTIAGGGLTPDD